MTRYRHPVEITAAVLPAPDVAAGPQTPFPPQRVLVLPARPGHDPDARALLRGPVELEGKALAAHRDPDDVLPRRRAEIGVRRQRRADADAPALARPHLRQETVDVEDHRRRRLACQNHLEVTPRERVLALQEERAGELQTDPDQTRSTRLPDQHGMEDRDGLVQKPLAPLLRHARLLRRADRGKAVKEERVGARRPFPDRRTQDGQGVLVPAVPDQHLRLSNRIGGEAYRRRRLLGDHRHGEEQERRRQRGTQRGPNRHRRVPRTIIGKKEGGTSCHPHSASPDPEGRVLAKQNPAPSDP